MNITTTERKQVQAQARNGVVCRAIISGLPDGTRLPDAAIEWPVVELASSTILRGSGESTTFHAARTVRVDGRQAGRAVGYAIADLALPERLIAVGKGHNRTYYVQWPEFIPSNPPNLLTPS